MKGKVIRLLQVEERQASELVRATESSFPVILKILNELVEEDRVTTFKRKNKLVYKIVRETWETPHWGFSPANR